MTYRCIVYDMPNKENWIIFSANEVFEGLNPYYFYKVITTGSVPVVMTSKESSYIYSKPLFLIYKALRYIF